MPYSIPTTGHIETPHSELPETLELPFDRKHPRHWFDREVWHRLASVVPEDSYTDTDQIFPLQWDTSDETIARCVGQFSDGDCSRTYGVYVFECFRQPVPRAVALKNQVSSNSVRQYYDLENPRRMLYVGVAKDVPQRVGEHLNDPGRRGAYFTAIYRPVRLLQVGWFNNQTRARRGEKLTAKFLRERFPDDYVAQPG